MPKKRTILFFTVVVISFVLMTYQNKKGHRVSGNAFNSLLSSSHSVAQSFIDALKRPFKRLALREEDNVMLKKRLGTLLMEKEKYQAALLENKRLREVLKFRDTQNSYVAAARVVARGVDHWTNTLVLDKGIRDGLARDMAAVTPKGLAGKVFQVSDSYANLLLLTDINFSAAVRLQESRHEGVLSGTGTRKCVLKYVPYEEEIKIGDIVITSGLDSLFPPGIPVGYISRVDNKGRGGNFQYIEVMPFQDNARMEEVVLVR